MISALSQNRLLQSRVSFLEQSIKELSKKNIQIEHNTIAIQGKELYLQDLFLNISYQLSQLKSIKNEYHQYSLSDITKHQNSANKDFYSQQNQLKSPNFIPNTQFIQLFETLQSNTINNLQQLQQKITLSYQQLESKCSKMELKMLGIWKQAENLIQKLTFQIQTNQLKTKTIEDRINRDRQIINTTIKSFQIHLSSISNAETSKFNSDLYALRSSFQSQLKTVSQKVQSLDFQTLIQQTKNQIQTLIKKNNEKLFEKVQSQIQQTLKNSTSNLNSITNPNFNTQIQLLSNQINQTKTQLKQIQYQLKDIENQLKDKNNPRENWRTKFKQHSQESLSKKQFKPTKKQSEKFNSLHNSQENQDPWSSNSIDIMSKKPDHNTKIQPVNRLLSNQNIINPLNKAYARKQQRTIEKQEMVKQSQEVYGRGIAGLRNMKKKEEERNSSLSRNKNREQPRSLHDNDLRNPLSRGGNLRQLPGVQSPPKIQSIKGLPPLSSENILSKKPQMQRQQQIAPYQNYASTPENESDEEESYYVDEEGYLIDKEGARLINENGEQIQLSYEDIQRLREMQNSQNQEQL